MLNRSAVCPTLCSPIDCCPSGSSLHGDSPGKNPGVGCHALLQGIFLTQGLNPQILSHLNHQGSPRILEWVNYPFSRGSSQPRNWIGVSCFAGISIPAELPGKPYRSTIFYLLKNRSRIIFTYLKFQKSLNALCPLSWFILLYSTCHALTYFIIYYFILFLTLSQESSLKAEFCFFSTAVTSIWLCWMNEYIKCA